MRKLAVLGVGGGVAAYKAVEVGRGLRRAGYRVVSVLTDAALRFVQPVLLAAATGGPAYTDADFWRPDGTVPHVRLAERAHLVLVCPATADLLAKAALGLAGDFLTSLLLAYPRTVWFVPAMETAMWHHPATQGHVAALLERGHRILGPVEGPLASGKEGMGRMLAPEEVVAAVTRGQDLAGRTVVVTGGATREPLDPVRCLTNRSSGRMGVALAEAARDRGARVHLVLGAAQVPAPAGVRVHRVETAAEMLAVVQALWAEAEALVAAAAVADMRPAAASPVKVPKSSLPSSLALEPTPDILAWAGANKGHRVVVGFAAETGDPVPRAREKLAAKGVDLVVANDVTEPGAGFEVATNRVHLVWPDRVRSLPLLPKREVADQVMAWIAERLGAR